MQSPSAEVEAGCKLDLNRVTKKAIILKSDKAEVGVSVDYSCLYRTLLSL